MGKSQWHLTSKWDIRPNILCCQLTLRNFQVEPYQGRAMSHSLWAKLWVPADSVRHQSATLGIMSGCWTPTPPPFLYRAPKYAQASYKLKNTGHFTNPASSAHAKSAEANKQFQVQILGFNTPKLRLGYKARRTVKPRFKRHCSKGHLVLQLNLL